MRDTSFINGGQDNAMTEVALALAMGFFSLMVLTLVSMGSGSSSEIEKTDFQGIQIVETDTSSGDTASVTSNDLFVMYWNDSFYDQNGDAVDPRTLEAPEGGRIVLVVDPSTPFTEIVKAKSILSGHDVIVAEMSKEWVEAMSARGYVP